MNLKNSFCKKLKNLNQPLSSTIITKKFFFGPDNSGILNLTYPSHALKQFNTRACSHTYVVHECTTYIHVHADWCLYSSYLHLPDFLYLIDFSDASSDRIWASLNQLCEEITVTNCVVCASIDASNSQRNV